MLGFAPSRNSRFFVGMLKNQVLLFWRLVKSLAVFTQLRFKSTKLLQVSSSLTLTTLLSLVPLLAVLLSAFAVFPMFDDLRWQIEHAIFSSLLPEAYQDVIVGYLRRFASHAGGLTVAGIAGLAVTAFMLINTIDTTINQIFGATRKRALPKRVAIYLAIVFFGPLLITTSGVLMKEAVMTTSLDRHFPTIVGIGIDLALSGLAYALLYFLIANIFVRFKYCLIGGFFVSSAAMCAKWGFALYLARSPMSAIYGPFVALPIGMLWIYVSWSLILGGAAIAASIPMLTCGRFSDIQRPGNEFATAVNIMRTLTQAQSRDVSEMSFRRLIKTMDTYPQLAQRVLEKLEQKGLVKSRRILMRSDRWSLNCDPTTTSLNPVFEAFALDPAITLIQPEKGPLASFNDDLRSAKALATPIAELFL